MRKRKIDIAVISDVHLGSRACRAEELLAYLSSISPSILVLNGDIAESLEPGVRFFPKSHLKIIRKIMNLAASGTQVYYLTGDRDRLMRKFIGSQLGNLRVRDRLVLNLGGRKAWFFHGDVLDLTPSNTRWLARFGSPGYGVMGWLARKLGRFKRSPGCTATRVGAFRKAVTDLAIDKGYDSVVCGHLHQPEKAWIETPKGQCLYLNSGDWTEHLTALEYAFKRWRLYRYREDKLPAFYADEELKQWDTDALLAALLGGEPDKQKETPETL